MGCGCDVCGMSIPWGGKNSLLELDRNNEIRIHFKKKKDTILNLGSLCENGHKILHGKSSELMVLL